MLVSFLKCALCKPTPHPLTRACCLTLCSFHLDGGPGAGDTVGAEAKSRQAQPGVGGSALGQGLSEVRAPVLGLCGRHTDVTFLERITSCTQAASSTPPPRACEGSGPQGTDFFISLQNVNPPHKYL